MNDKPQLERLMGVSLALTSLIELKDEYTRGHSINTRRLAGEFAEYLGLDPRTVEDIRLAAQLHDIGKIGIPDAILKKSSDLTDKEYAAVMRHPELGANAVRSIEGCDTVAEIIGAHHERFDGSGYPRRLAGKSIPLGARIVSLADTYDALVHGRAYREPMTAVNAMDVIASERGGQFDPGLTERFIQFLRQPQADNVHDPVCGMSANRADDTLYVRYDEQTWHFCSMTCLQAFRNNPGKYIRPEY